MAHDSSLQAIDTKLSVAVYSEQLIEPFKKEFPNTYDLMKYNLLGTLQLLKAVEVLEMKRIKDETTAADHSGETARTWAEYEHVIVDRLGKIDGLSDKRMAQAIPTIADKIYRQYYIRYPYWPPLGKSHDGYVNVTCSGSHECKPMDTSFQVTWSCEGNMYVKDNHPYASRYECQVSGQPVFKILYFNLDKLKAVEGAFGAKMTAIKAKVDEYHSKEADAERVLNKLDALLL